MYTSSTTALASALSFVKNTGGGYQSIALTALAAGTLWPARGVIVARSVLVGASQVTA